MTERHPGATCYLDRHGKTRWRYRRAGKTTTLPGGPGEPDFEEAYQAAVEGRKPRTASVVRIKGASLPETFGAAWRKVLASPEWKTLDKATHYKNTLLAEEFLDSRVAEDMPVLWRDIRVAELKRRHLKEIISSYSETPHKAKHLLVALRKMITAALDEEWIEVDPSYKFKWRPAYKGWKAWTPAAMEKFEARWPLGSGARVCYALALWLGNRRGDVASLRWDQRCSRNVIMGGVATSVEGFVLVQEKTGTELFVPITPMLAEILDATEKRGPTILVTQYGLPFSPKSLTGMMAHWTKLAGIEPGYTLHGLRKTLGKMLAEGGASTRQLMKILGHDDMEHAELYSREAEQVLLATEGMEKVTNLVNRRRG